MDLARCCLGCCCCCCCETPRETAVLNECCWSFFHQRTNLPWTLPRVVERKDSHHGSSWFTKRIERSYGCSVVLLVVVVVGMNAENGAGDTQQIDGSISKTCEYVCDCGTMSSLGLFIHDGLWFIESTNQGVGVVYPAL